MSTSLAILGRQPSIGIAELVSLHGSDAVRPLGKQAALLEVAHTDVRFARLGGTVKLAKLLTILDDTDWNMVEAYLLQELPKHVCCIPEGKLTLGLSLYGFTSIHPRRVNATALALKKVVKADDRPIRIVPNTSLELSSAQVLHNKLFTSHNWELILVKANNKTYLAQTTNVQNIDAYAARDQKRPKRDARVGMLPPKLAQTIVNLATGPADPSTSKVVFDPFCGTGVVLQEALLMGFDILGSDLDQRMVDFSAHNLAWLTTHQGITPAPSLSLDDIRKRLSADDATTAIWHTKPDVIACETYLGRPFSSIPDHATLAKVIADVDTIHRKFLQNAARQTSPGFRMCIAVPAWNTSNGFKHLKTLDSLEELGYNRLSFVHAKHSDLIYHREGQIVGRELVVLERK